VSRDVGVLDPELSPVIGCWFQIMYSRTTLVAFALLVFEGYKMTKSWFEILGARRVVRAAAFTAVLAGMAGSVVGQVVIAPEPPDPPAPDLTDALFDLTGAPPALSTVPVPTPPDLIKYVRDVNAARVLGKMLFWDMQAGSDGVTACASCHYHAGADGRPKNTLAPKGPGTPIAVSKFKGPGHRLKADYFPLRKLTDPTDQNSVVLSDTTEVVGSAGVVKRNFVSILPGSARDNGNLVADPVFHVAGLNTRQVTDRNSPSVINAVFYDRQFWDGRGNRFFNGVNEFGDADPAAKVWRYTALGGLEQVSILIDNGSLASQAVGPANSEVEMAWKGRSFAQFGRKMLSLRPLAQQFVAADDSLLGPYSAGRIRGTTPTTSYAALIRQAFQPEWWEAPTPVDGVYTQMESNFALFWGLAIQMYEATLVSDQSPYDRFMNGDATALSNSAKQGLEIFLHQGTCIQCHIGSEFSGATVSVVRPAGLPPAMVEGMIMGDGNAAYYDTGYYNIGVRPTQEDLGVGGSGPVGPWSLTRRAQAGLDVGLPVPIGPTDRIAVNGAFKSVTLRNIDLTGPYMHNGGFSTLHQVMEFYARGGNFRDLNLPDLDAEIAVLPDIIANPTRIQNLVDFLKSLTDPRVAAQSGPFDHPELILSADIGPATGGLRGDQRVTIPATGTRGGVRARPFDQILLDGKPN